MPELDLDELSGGISKPHCLEHSAGVLWVKSRITVSQIGEFQAEAFTRAGR